MPRYFFESLAKTERWYTGICWERANLRMKRCAHGGCFFVTSSVEQSDYFWRDSKITS